MLIRRVHVIVEQMLVLCEAIEADLVLAVELTIHDKTAFGEGLTDGKAGYDSQQQNEHH